MARSAFTMRPAIPAVIVALLLSVLACGIGSGGAPSGTGTGPLTIDKDTTFGSGPFSFTRMTAGLSDLTSYTVALTMTFDGTRAGKPDKWSKNYTMLADNNSTARQWMIEKTQDGQSLDPQLLAELDGLDYERPGQDPCTAKVIRPDQKFSDQFELASFLGAVIGAEQAGSELVSGVQAAHYTFDEHALGQAGVTQSSGELWVAAEGGYLVKYLLSTKAKADFFGEGVEGTLTYNYELTDANQPVKIELPQDCPPGMVDVPLLPDASSVVRSPGSLMYETASSLKDAAAFYEKGLPDLGWKSSGAPGVSETIGALYYAQGTKTLTLILLPKDGKVTVSISLGRVQQQ